MKIVYSDQVKYHEINKEFKCLTVSWDARDTNLKLHRTRTGGRIYKIDYMPRVDEMMEIIRAYVKISPEFKQELKGYCLELQREL